MEEKISYRLSFLINTAYIAVLIGLAYLCFRYVLSWVLPFILAFIIVSVVHPLIRRMQKWMHFRKVVASLVVMLLIYILVGVLIVLLVMQLVLIIQEGLTYLPEYFESIIFPALTRAADSVGSFLGDLPRSWQEQFYSVQDELISGLKTFVVNLSTRGFAALSGVTTRLPTFFIAMLFTIMLSFFISMQYDDVVKFLHTQLPKKAQVLIRDLKQIIIGTVFKYCKAAITLMFITFGELTVGLLVLRVPNAIPIAAGIAVFDALPFVGTGAIMIPWVIIELLQGNFTLGIGLGILYGIVTLVRSIIEPKVVGDKLGLNPIVSLTSIYLGFRLFGVLGMIFMPIVMQILLELHRTGNLTLYRSQKGDQP